MSNSPLVVLDKNLDFLFNEPGSHEATFDVLEDLLTEYPELIEVLETRFYKASSEDKRHVYAVLIVDFKPIDPYKSYLISHHDWEESDFE